LFCFPQFPERAELALWLEKRGMNIDQGEQLTAFRHTFSHFHLDIVPFRLDISAGKHCMDDGAGLWYNLAQPPAVGLAAPVERLLMQVKDRQPVVTYPADHED
jgi:A/G-specific adenine glycosylase